MHSTLQILSRARELISDPKNWVQGIIATDRSGKPSALASSATVCFCAVGALKRATIEHGYSPLFSITAQIKLSETMGNETTIHFNDTHSHAEVLAKFDEAIRNAQS
jgi:hypothetical protein